MPQSHDQWEKNMIKKFGSVEAGREEMKRRRALAKTHGKGGFKYLKDNDPEKLKEIQDKARQARWRSDVTDDI